MDGNLGSTDGDIVFSLDIRLISMVSFPVPVHLGCRRIQELIAISDYLKTIDLCKLIANVNSMQINFLIKNFIFCKKMALRPPEEVRIIKKSSVSQSLRL